jgi:hypothetical protein
MRRCWRSWRLIWWKLSPPCSLWRTNAPGLQKAVRGTLQPRQDPLRRVDPVLLPLAAARKGTRRTVALTSHGSGVRPLLLRRLGARTPEASAHVNSAPTPGRALSTLGLATAPPSSARSRSSRSALARGVTKALGKPPPLRGGPARRKPLMPTQPQRRGSWGIKPQTKTSRVSSTRLTPSPVVTSAARSCTSCTAAVRSSSPGGTSRPFAERSSR